MPSWPDGPEHCITVMCVVQHKVLGEHDGHLSCFENMSIVWHVLILRNEWVNG
jgi:hypothetical protein